MPIPERNQDCMNRAEQFFLAACWVAEVPSLLEKGHGRLHLPGRAYLVVSLFEGEVMAMLLPFEFK